MSIIAVTLVAIAGVLSGLAVGTVFGFSLASHKDVMSGFRPSKANRFIQWLARPSREFTSSESLLFLLFMLVWLAVFFVLCAVPVLVAVKLDGEGSPLIAFSLVVFVVAAYLGRQIGRRLWLQVL